jgi:hypothetical protein
VQAGVFPLGVALCVGGVFLLSTRDVEKNIDAEGRGGDSGEEGEGELGGGEDGSTSLIAHEHGVGGGSSGRPRSISSPGKTLRPSVRASAGRGGAARAARNSIVTEAGEAGVDDFEVSFAGHPVGLNLSPTFILVQGVVGPSNPTGAKGTAPVWKIAEVAGNVKVTQPWPIRQTTALDAFQPNATLLDAHQLLINQVLEGKEAAARLAVDQLLVAVNGMLLFGPGMTHSKVRRLGDYGPLSGGPLTARSLTAVERISLSL